MRWIDQDKIQLPEGWIDRAAQAKQRVMVDGAKPDDFDGVWRCLKDPFAVISDKRCWICEAPAARSDNAIDHFRPKNRVAEAVGKHSGYKWLAFKLSNFRYICTFCNSKRKDRNGGTEGGKADHFPLQDEASRAYCEDDDTDDEVPLLLDPCEEGEWKLLGCSVESGSPVAATDDPKECERVSVSISLYHLHQDALNKMRLSQIRDLDQKIVAAKDRYNELDGSAKRQKKYRDALKPILRMISPGSDFSGEMYNHLKKRRVIEHPWLQTLLG
ncbi:hypothetical protein PsW64_02999 [Pseudovibrio sp. W64]|uniref:hypothetical protein n=1 Tax=Pseudovibrio sp. W64 TaxID=1735583 RepID=UPI0007AE815C|nr:hypothetical protein [Pseudovibrio sp. W64]KZK79375.1 hypothetical protein PsW64_02999 [Pseudovibrio sp. W64]